ncbi:testis-expressed protein 11 [Patella vulgata]|uniref:testis-expressed protein 11 n=1 Tax=Patella vulgata TaxID=6465 RepID=UPI0021802A75|nr:testis-expressed protein 11 [Patella vulgata]
MEFTPEARENVVKLFQGNVEKLCSVKESVVPEWWLNVVDKTSEILLQLKTNSFDEKNKDTNSKIIENNAVKLWNHIVPMKTQGSLSNISNAKLRHICFMAVTYSGSDSVDDAVLKRQTIMGMKTARAWIECNQMEQAEIVLNVTHQCVEKLKTTLINRINAGNTSGNGVNCGTLEKDRLEVDRDILKILTCKAEVASAQMQTETAINLIFTAKEMLARFPREGSYMSMLCYNFGVDTFQRKQYEESVTWLKESYELGKGREGLDPKNQARTLRFLANVYLEWNEDYYCDKAMNAITLANTVSHKYECTIDQEPIMTLSWNYDFL